MKETLCFGFLMGRSQGFEIRGGNYEDKFYNIFTNEVTNVPKNKSTTIMEPNTTNEESNNFISQEDQFKEIGGYILVAVAVSIILIGTIGCLIYCLWKIFCKRTNYAHERQKDQAKRDTEIPEIKDVCGCDRSDLDIYSLSNDAPPKKTVCEASKANQDLHKKIQQKDMKPKDSTDEEENGDENEDQSEEEEEQADKDSSEEEPSENTAGGKHSMTAVSKQKKLLKRKDGSTVHQKAKKDVVSKQKKLLKRKDDSTVHQKAKKDVVGNAVSGKVTAKEDTLENEEKDSSSKEIEELATEAVRAVLQKKLEKNVPSELKKKKRIEGVNSVIPKQNSEAFETDASKSSIAEKDQSIVTDDGTFEDLSQGKPEKVKFLGYVVMPKVKDAVNSDINLLQLSKQIVDKKPKDVEVRKVDKLKDSSVVNAIIEDTSRKAVEDVEVVTDNSSCDIGASKTRKSMKHHKAEKNMRCPNCPRKFADSSSVRNHYAQIHMNESIVPLNSSQEDTLQSISFRSEYSDTTGRREDLSRMTNVPPYHQNSFSIRNEQSDRFNRTRQVQQEHSRQEQFSRRKSFKQSNVPHSNDGYFQSMRNNQSHTVGRTRPVPVQQFSRTPGRKSFQQSSHQNSFQSMRTVRRTRPDQDQEFSRTTTGRKSYKTSRQTIICPFCSEKCDTNAEHQSHIRQVHNINYTFH